MLLLTVLLAGCNLNYLRGKALEQEKRWEEAAIEYHLAYINDADDAEIKQALERTNKVLARENFQLYREFLAKKAFRKAYGRLVDAERQDPGYAPVKAEIAKWERVLVSGQVLVQFQTAQTGLALADEVKLVVRINTPNPGKTLEAEVDLDTGFFFAEDLLYDRPGEFLVYYSLNSVGASMVFGRTRIKKFTSREFHRFIRFRTPILDDIQGRIAPPADGAMTHVREHRKALPAESWNIRGIRPRINPHYSVTIRGNVVKITSPGARPDFTPRFLYVNRKNRRVFVDFGRYETRFDPLTRAWKFRRLPLDKGEYFDRFSRNIALQPYFFYRGDVFVFELTHLGASG